jgi:hypothetical protein
VRAVRSFSSHRRGIRWTWRLTCSITSLPALRARAASVASRRSGRGWQPGSRRSRPRSRGGENCLPVNQEDEQRSGRVRPKGCIVHKHATRSSDGLPARSRMRMRDTVAQRSSTSNGFVTTAAASSLRRASPLARWSIAPEQTITGVGHPFVLTGRVCQAWTPLCLEPESSALFPLQSSAERHRSQIMRQSSGWVGSGRHCLVYPPRTG